MDELPPTQVASPDASLEVEARDVETRDHERLPTANRSDLVLARQIQAGDRSAFDSFYDLTAGPVLRFTRSRLRGRDHLVDDVVQSTLCQALESLPRFRGESTLLSWVLGIARFKALEVLRREGRETLTPLPEIELLLERLERVDHPEGHEALVQKDLVAAIHNTLDHLPAHYAKALEAKYAHQETTRAIAEQLELSEKATESLLTRARAAFRAQYRELLNDSPSAKS